jgi:hypothetical protein
MQLQAIMHVRMVAHRWASGEPWGPQYHPGTEFSCSLSEQGIRSASMTAIGDRLKSREADIWSETRKSANDRGIYVWHRRKEVMHITI